jgi:hypothetical protein
VKEYMEALIRAIYSFSFKLFGITISSTNITGTIWSLLDIGTLFNSNKFELYQYVETINGAIASLGLSLLTLFFMINLIKLLTQEGVERISWERIVLRAAVFFMLVAFINNSMDWFKSLAQVVQDSVLIPVKNTMSLVATQNVNIAEELINMAKNEGKIERYLWYAVYIILAIPYMATLVMILSQVFLRAVKLLIYIMFSPIPIAMAAEGDTYRGKALSYFMGFCGVCFEAVVIYIGTFIYAKGFNSIASSPQTEGIGLVIAILFMNGLFSAMIGLSSQLSEKFFGRG